MLSSLAKNQQAQKAAWRFSIAQSGKKENSPNKKNVILRFFYTVVDIIAPEQDPCLSRPVICRVNTGEGIYGLGKAGVAIGAGSPDDF
jgi:hypothetical protein